MDEEFKLCWKNFQDNIASGFQNLYDRGDLVDVTLACDGKLLHAHKIVLAICSPYFQEIFITNPCKHPIIILKDVTFNIMCELLEFMYQGVVNVKHAELQSFMKIGQLLQIKGLATNSSSSAASTSSEKSTSQTHNAEEPSRTNENSNAPTTDTPIEEKSDSVSETNTNPPIGISKQGTTNSNRSRSPSTSTTPLYTSGLVQHQPNIKSENSPALHHAAAYHAANVALKRQVDFSSAESSSSLFSRKQLRRSIASATADQNSDLSDANESATGIDSMSNDDFLLPSISMVESRYDLNNLKREHSNVERDYRDGASAAAAVAAAASLRNTFGAPFGFDYNLYKNGSNATSGNASSGSSTQQAEYPNELHMPNDYSKNFGNHMEIPSSGNNLVMLSSTSLLHGNCVFNRNNTVATQQGMKTYWLCKSYRVSMCRARCITHQGRIISATGVHNHPPHMRGGPNGSNSGTALPVTSNNSGYISTTENNIVAPSTTQISSGCIAGASTAIAGNTSGLCNTTIHSLSRLSQNTGTSNVFAHNMHGHSSQQSESPPHHASLFTHTHHHTPPTNHHHHAAQSSLTISAPSGSNGVIQNMFHNAANLMQLPNMLPPPSSHHEQHHHHHQQQQQQQHQHHQHHTQQQQQQHSPHLSHHSSHLEITSLMHSSSSNTSHPHNSALSNSPSMKDETTNNNALHSLPRSPSHMHMNDDTNNLANDQHIMVHNAAMSPSSEMNPPTNNGSSADVSLASQAEAEHDSSHHQAQVIDSITISPPNVAPGEHWFQGNLEFMLSQRGKPLLVHDGHTFGIQYVRKDKKYWQCNLSRKYNCKARVTTTETGDIIVTNNEHCHTEIRQHLRKDYQRQKVMMNALINLSTNRFAENLRRQHQQANCLSNSLSHLQQSLTTPPCANNIAGIAPLAAHSASNNATSMQRLLDLGKFSPNEQKNLAAALQKQEEDSEDNEPLDCGIRSTISDGVKDETVEDTNSSLKPHIEVNEKSATSAEEAADNFTAPHA